MTALDTANGLQELDVAVVRRIRPTAEGEEMRQHRFAVEVTGGASELSESELLSIAQLAISARLLESTLERRATFRSRVHSYLLRERGTE